MTRWIVQFSTTLKWAAELKDSHSAADPDGGMRGCTPPPCHQHTAFLSVKYRQSLAYLALSLANCYNQSRLLDLNALKKARARNGELTALPQTLQLNLRDCFAAGKGGQRRDKRGRKGIIPLPSIPGSATAFIYCQLFTCNFSCCCRLQLCSSWKSSTGIRPTAPRGPSAIVNGRSRYTRGYGTVVIKLTTKTTTTFTQSGRAAWRAE